MDRIRRELELVQRQFGRLSVGPDLDWFIVEEFLLSHGLYNRSHTRLLHFIGKAHPQTPPDNFLVPVGLRTAAGELPGNGYRESQEHLGEKWGIFSWHPKQWHPAADVLEGDNFVTFLLTVRARLQEVAV